MIFKLVLRLYCKGEGKPSPFVYTGIFLFFLSFASGQFNSENWLHPFQYDTSPTDSGNFIQIINNSHVGLIQFDDSLNIFQLNSTIKGQKKLTRGLIYFSHYNYQSTIDKSMVDYSFSIYNNYFQTGVGYIFRLKNLTTGFGITKFSNNNNISPSVSLGVEFFPWLKGEVGRAISQAPFNIKMNYTDFEYTLESILTTHDITNYEMELSGEFGKIKYSFTDDYWKIASDETLRANLDFEIGASRNHNLRGELLLNKKQKIILHLSNQLDITKIDFLNDSENSFLKVNKFSSDNYKFALNYQNHSNNYFWEIGLFQQQLTILMSNRIRPSRISTDLESFYNSAAILNNKNTGELIQRGISIKLDHLRKNKLKPYYQVDWVSDAYDINLNTISLSLLGGIPSFYDDQNLNIIRKDAIIISCGFNLIQYKWGVQMDISQHIPYYIKVRKVYPQGLSDDKVESYGGGLFQLTLTRYLD